MSASVTRQEFKVLEDVVDSEKRVTRFILEQTRTNGKRLDNVEERLGQMERRLDRVEQKLDSLDLRFNTFVREYPATVADIMRRILRERDEKSKPQTTNT